MRKCKITEAEMSEKEFKVLLFKRINCHLEEMHKLGKFIHDLDKIVSQMNRTVNELELKVQNMEGPFSKEFEA